MVIDKNALLDETEFEEDELSEEELDELYRPQKMNSRKTLAPLFMFQILVSKTYPGKSMSQQEIINELQKFPYEIEIKRSAISRILHNLSDSGLGIVSSRRGSYYDETRRWA